MTWLLAAILAYFFLAVVSLFDRYFLVGPVHEPKVYAFWVGLLTFLAAFLILPFGVNIPGINLVLTGLVSGLLRLFAILFLYKGIRQTEVSRAVPAMNGLLPIFTFLIFLSFFPNAEYFSPFQIVAFVLLVAGSILISSKNFSFSIFSFKNLKYPAISALFFSVSFFLSKNLFLKTDFSSGLFTIMAGVGLGAVCFFIFPGFKKSLAAQKAGFKTSSLVVLGQVFGAMAVLLQFYSIFLAETGQVPLINALEGSRDVFLLLFVFILSRWRPNILKEKMAGFAGFQKILAVLLIAAGLVIFALK